MKKNNLTASQIHLKQLSPFNEKNQNNQPKKTTKTCYPTKTPTLLWNIPSWKAPTRKISNAIKLSVHQNICLERKCRVELIKYSLHKVTPLCAGLDRVVTKHFHYVTQYCKQVAFSLLTLPDSSKPLPVNSGAAREIRTAITRQALWQSPACCSARRVWRKPLFIAAESRSAPRAGNAAGREAGISHTHTGRAAWFEGWHTF